MIVHYAPQGSEEWFQARAGVISGSNFSECRKVVGGLTEQQQVYVDAMRAGHSESKALELAKYKAAPKMTDKVQKALDGEMVGDFSSAAYDYAFKLAVERIAGKSIDGGFQTAYMKRGNDLEPEARMTHESIIMQSVTEVGFVTTDDGKFGASADGFIGDDGGAEYKCFLAPEKVRAFWINFDPSIVMDQVQGGMWITGRKYWDIGMYCPELAPANKELWLKRVERDDDYIELLELDLLRFEKVVTDYENKLRSKAV